MGTGYTTAPSVSFSAPSHGSNTATAIASVSGGKVTAITLTNPGSGYTSQPTITISGGGGSGAAANVTFAAAGSPGPGGMMFQYSFNNGTSWSAVLPTGSGPYTYTIPSTGATVTFPSGTYSQGDTYSWTTTPAILLTSAASDTLPVRWWGAKGDGSTDDTGPVQAAIYSALNATAGLTVLFALGIYKVTATILADWNPGAGTPAYFQMRGASGSELGYCTLKYAGPAGSPLLTLRNLQDANFRDLAFDGGGLASYVVQMLYQTSGLTFDHCVFTNSQVVPVWTQQHYNVGDQALAPMGSNRVTADNGYLYQVVTAGTSTMSTSAAATLFDAHVAYGTQFTETGSGVPTWQVVGASPAAFLVGQIYPLTDPVTGNAEAADSTWRDCRFASTYVYNSSQGSRGWATAQGQNVKDFHLSRCYFESCSIGLDWLAASGFVSGEGHEYGDNALDIRTSTGGAFTVNGFSSEGSQMFYVSPYGSSISGWARFMNGYWIGNTPAAGGVTAPCMSIGANVELVQCNLQDANKYNSNNYPYIVLVGEARFAGGEGSLRSTGNVFVCNSNFAGPFVLPVFDQAGSRLVTTAAYASLPLALLSVHDTMFSGGGPVNLPRYDGERWNGTALVNGLLADGTATVACANSSAGSVNASQMVMLDNTLSANRTLTLSTDSAVSGEVIDIVRFDGSAHTLAIVNGGSSGGTLITLPASQRRKAQFKFDGTNWSLVSVVSLHL